MEDLKKAWTQTGKSLVIAINDLGVSLIKTAKVGVDAALEWARKDNPHVQVEGQEVPDQQPAAETPQGSADE